MLGIPVPAPPVCAAGLGVLDSSEPPLLLAVFWGLYGGIRGAKGDGTQPLFWDGVWDSLLWGFIAAGIGAVIGLIGSGIVRTGAAIVLVILSVWTLTVILTGIFFDGFAVPLIARGIVGDNNWHGGGVIMRISRLAFDSK